MEQAQMKGAHKKVRGQVKRLAHCLEAWYDVKSKAQLNIEQIKREIQQLKHNIGSTDHDTRTED
jgi:hypothetical protein